MKPTYKQAIQIIQKAWEGSESADDYPDYDDVNTSIGVLKELVEGFYAIRRIYETRD